MKQGADLSLKAAIGNTPLVKLRRLLPNARFNLYAKLEMLNPGGSMKDRPAFHMVSMALKNGQVKKAGTIIESSSGNMGIGLAQACRYFGIKFVCVVDDRINKQSIKILKALNAKIEKVTINNQKQDRLALRLKRVAKLVESNPGSFWINQYKNIYNPKAYLKMMAEINKALKGKVDFLFCATGTCGTIRGCVDYVKLHKLPTKVIAVDAVGSVIFGGKPATRLVPGHGSSIKPYLFQSSMTNGVIYASDMDCVKGCRLLLHKEAIMAGGSTGALVSAAKQYSSKIPSGANVVIIAGDRGERYLDTIYNDEWVAKLPTFLEATDE